MKDLFHHLLVQVVRVSLHFFEEPDVYEVAKKDESDCDSYINEKIGVFRYSKVAKRHETQPQVNENGAHCHKEEARDHKNRHEAAPHESILEELSPQFAVHPVLVPSHFLFQLGTKVLDKLVVKVLGCKWFRIFVKFS